MREASYWERLENRPEAIRAYEAALPLARKNAWLRIRLGELLRDAGDLPRAAALMREAVGAGRHERLLLEFPRHGARGQGDFAEAEKAFREATSRETANAKYAYNLGPGSSATRARRQRQRSAFARR